MRFPFFRRSARREVGEELRFHIEGRIHDLVARGWDEEEARREVLRRFGDYDSVEETCRRYTRERHRRERGAEILGDLLRDARVATRALIRRPGFTVTVVATLALAIGASSAVFSVVDGVLLEPLPYPDSDRLVRLFQQNSPNNRWPLSVVDFQAVRERQRTFESVAAVAPWEVAVSGADGAEWARVGLASAGFFSSLGTSPAIGRGILPHDELPEAAPVVVLSDAFRSRRFAGGERVLGGSLVLNGVTHEIVGVLPPGVNELAGIRAELWPVLQLAEPTRRGPFFLHVIGRLQAGISLEHAADDLARISREIYPRWRESFQDETAILTPFPLRKVMVGDVRTILLILLGVVGLVLLIALANLANLMLFHAAARERELAVRAALGAGRRRLGRMFLTESLVVAGLGAVIGLAVAVTGVEVLRGIAASLPRIHEVAVDARVMAVTLALAMGCGVVLAAVSLWFGGRREAADALRGGGRGRSAAPKARRLRSVLVTAEFALALPVLGAAGLLLNTLVNLQRVDPGVDPRGITAVRIALPTARYPGAADRQRFWDEAIRRVAAIPGIESVGLSTGLPPDRPGTFNNFDLLDRAVDAGAAQSVSPWSSITTSLLDVLDVPLYRGRLFQRSDSLNAPPVALISQAWAERYYPGTDPVGKRFISGGCLRCAPSTVVGVVGDVKFTGLEGGGEAVYVPWRQGPPSRGYLVIRGSRSSLALLPDVRVTLAEVDPDLPLTDVTTLEQRLHASLAAPRRWTLLLGTLAGAAGLLAAVGVFGVLSYAVRRQKRDIGVRIALGADRRRVVRMVVGQAMRWVGVGTALGAGAYLVVGQALESQLFHVQPADPLTLTSVATLLALIALVAAWIPARRAASVDPVEAITSD